MFSLSAKNTIDIGSPAPSISVLNQEGDTIDLGAILSDGLALIFFYPKANTPGCTMQACSLRDDFSILKNRGVTVIGASSDSPNSQKSFKDKFELPYPLIADKSGDLAKAFGKNKWSRQAYLFSDGVLVWKDSQASTAKQSKDVIEVLDRLGLGLGN